MKGKAGYTFTATVWRHAGQGGWYFVALPMAMAHEIRTHLRPEEEGWGRLKATAHIGHSTWDTAIWYDTRRDTYLLPLKADVRRTEGIADGAEIKATVWE